MLPLEAVVLREILNCSLKESKLIRDEWIAMDEMIPVLKITIGL
jgi:hypothetical protein